MKKVFALIIFLVMTGFYGQNKNDDFSKGSGLAANTFPISPKQITESISAHEDGEYGMETAFRENAINIKQFENQFNNTPGFYIISNVFKSEAYLIENLENLQKKGFDAGFLFNPEDQLNYLYLQRFETWQEALQACKTKLNGSYTKEVWVMIAPNGVDQEEPTSLVLNENIEKRSESKEDISLEMVSYEMLTTLAEKEDPLRAGRPTNGNSWIKKANEYFDKMWYAEAASFYEKALEKNPGNYSLEILQKAGDSHYFNTNMERAYFWYDKMYDKYKEDINPNYLFRYAHTLKGSGKYGRAKRMMRLYNRKAKGADIEQNQDEDYFEADANEVVLDNILSTTHESSLKNLSVNSKYSEFAPMFYSDNEMVFSSSRDSSFFNTRRYKWNDQPFLDLYVAKINEESLEVKDAIKFSKRINTKYHEAAVTFSADNATMYFTRNNYVKKLGKDKNGMSHLKIYVSKKVDGEWTEAKELPFNSDSYSTGHPALSPDGKKLYFVSDMPGSIGETDIFVVDVLGEDQFSEPKNLGPKVNSERKEMFPFVTNKKLYFSSNGRIGLGGLDIYEAVLGEDGGFLEAINLGLPINSKNDDFSYIVNEDNNKGFFASNRTGGKGDDDLYSFERMIPEEVVKNAIAGTVVELITGAVMPNALVTLLDDNNIKLKEIVTDDDGSFVFEDLDSNTKYSVQISNTEFFDNVILAETKKNEVVAMEFQMKKLKEMIILEDGIRKLKTDMIFFDFDKSYIRKDAAVELDKLVEVMSQNKDMVIKIESHTDSRGPAVYNKYLSDKRAKSSRNYLISKGISKDRIESAIGYGEEQLLNECKDGIRCNRQKHELNRRSEFIIVKM
ncbi:OmpA family protein [Arenibacter sp. H213]|uniref:OmpA family protein n=1 Tax=Arenibacter antarcticus TaxID=2040469 RepID=A0ABW5VAW2_9FLAO|nr:OmpA family protein [Arenibacter sp. H213]